MYYFCGHLVYFMVIWYIFHVLDIVTKNLATLLQPSYVSDFVSQVTAIRERI
jgi:hypothetical protein